MEKGRGGDRVGASMFDTPFIMFYSAEELRHKLSDTSKGKRSAEPEPEENRISKVRQGANDKGKNFIFSQTICIYNSDETR